MFSAHKLRVSLIFYGFISDISNTFTPYHFGKKNWCCGETYFWWERINFVSSLDTKCMILTIRQSGNVIWVVYLPKEIHSYLHHINYIIRLVSCLCQDFSSVDRKNAIFNTIYHLLQTSPCQTLFTKIIACHRYSLFHLQWILNLSTFLKYQNKY